MKTVISVKTDIETKDRARAIAQQLGIPLSTILNAYLKELGSTGTVHFSTANTPQIIGGQVAVEQIARRLTTAQGGLTGFVFNGLSNLYDFIEIDETGALVANDYVKTMLRVGDRFVFPGTEESIALAKDLLLRFPEIQNKFEPRWIDASKLDIRINFFVFDNTTIFYSGEKEAIIGYVIENRDVAHTFKNLSLFLWENANTIL